MSYIRYANQGATRNRPLSPDLEKRLAYLEALGIQAEVFSGGQPGKDEGGARVGSTRHDHGNAADVFFYKDGRKLDWANEQDRPYFEQIVREGKANGITGFGAGPGYMQAGSMHIGMGNPGVWGAGGKGDNAPEWLSAAYNGATSAKPTVRDNPMVLDEVLAAGGKAPTGILPPPTSEVPMIASSASATPAAAPTETPKEPSEFSKGITKFGEALGFKGKGDDASFLGMKLGGDDGLLGDLAGLAGAFGKEDSSPAPVLVAQQTPTQPVQISFGSSFSSTPDLLKNRKRRGGLGGFGGMYV